MINSKKTNLVGKHESLPQTDTDSKIKGISLYFSKLDYYKIEPLIDILSHPDSQFIDVEASKLLFKKDLKEKFEPIIDFLIQQKVEANLIITGNFVQSAAELMPSLLKKIRQLIDLNQITLVANAFYGNSLTSLYNIDWWTTTVSNSIKTINYHLQTVPELIFIPQLYRNLELERVIHKTNITSFLCRHKSDRQLEFNIKLSDLRRFEGKKPSWIKLDNDVLCNFYFEPDNQFFDVNQLSLGKASIPLIIKSLNMKVGLASTKAILRPKITRLNTNSRIRINDNYSTALFKPLERAIIRLWGYGSNVILTEHSLKPTPYSQELFYNFAALQNTDYLLHLRPENYSSNKVGNFVSPYEAFVNMQSAVKKAEIVLRKMI
jgi:Glycosyl hydrolase family 57